MKIVLLCFSIIFFSSCESEQQRKVRLQNEEQRRVAQAERLEQERQEKEVYDKYINNSLQTGSTPYKWFFGGNLPCQEYGCSEIKVTTPSNSDVLVTIKKNGRVVRHAYIKANSSFTFHMANGIYQPFFYYGKGWNPEKVMKETPEGTIRGGFIADESFGKDDPQNLNNAILEYRLILQTNGNFRTKPSNANDAL
jgi:hypothetical protein